MRYIICGTMGGNKTVKWIQTKTNYQTDSRQTVQRVLHSTHQSTPGTKTNVKEEHTQNTIEFVANGGQPIVHHKQSTKYKYDTMVNHPPNSMHGQSSHSPQWSVTK